jgi:hypothetical protein
MIEIKDFASLKDKWSLGLIPRAVMDDLRGLEEGFETDAVKSEPFMVSMGGNAYICEKAADLEEITAIDFAWAEAHGQWPNITEKVLTWDAVEYKGNYCVIFLATNNAGGHWYYVPWYLWKEARIEENYCLHHNLPPTPEFDGCPF